MLRTFRTAFLLKNTYRVNTIIYSIKQIPLIKRLIPESLYKCRGLKIFAVTIAGIWEVLSAFLGKLLYLLIMVYAAGELYRGRGAEGAVFLHILFFLTVIGAFMNTYMFNPTNDKYYAMMLMRMDARAYTLTDYFYTIGKVVIGFLPFTIMIGKMRGIPLWMCILLPLFIAGTKLITAWLLLVRYERTGECTNENLPPKLAWTLTVILLAAAYGLPYLKIILPSEAFLVTAALIIITGGAAAFKIYKFNFYLEMYKLILADKRSQMDYKSTLREITQESNRKLISPDTGITSGKKGFEYFNELFVRRHRKVLRKPAERVAAIALIVMAGVLILLRINAGVKADINRFLLSYLPYFVFIMYMINRGTAFTQTLFMNCDHSMLTYSFYKQPHFILKLFRIRLREIIKVNLLPAVIIGAGLSVTLYFSGGTDNPLNYLLLFISILSMSVFFSVHYLTIYYLLQPYTLNTELKSPLYRGVVWVTYMVCFLFMKLRMNTFTFGVMVTVFCILYSAAACVLVYKYAHKTFRLRS